MLCSRHGSFPESFFTPLYLSISVDDRARVVAHLFTVSNDLSSKASHSSLLLFNDWGIYSHHLDQEVLTKKSICYKRVEPSELHLWPWKTRNLLCSFKKLCLNIEASEGRENGYKRDPALMSSHAATKKNKPQSSSQNAAEVDPSCTVLLLIETSSLLHSLAFYGLHGLRPHQKNVRFSRSVPSSFQNEASSSASKLGIHSLVVAAAAMRAATCTNVTADINSISWIETVEIMVLVLLPTWSNRVTAVRWLARQQIEYVVLEED